MIVLHILAHDETQAHDLSEVLLRERLWIDPFIEGEGITLYHDSGVMNEARKVKIHGKTRAALFDQVQRRIRELYPYQIPDVYAVPIVSMNWEDSEQLIQADSEEE